MPPKKRSHAKKGRGLAVVMPLRQVRGGMLAPAGAGWLDTLKSIATPVANIAGAFVPPQYQGMYQMGRAMTGVGGGHRQKKHKKHKKGAHRGRGALIGDRPS